MIEINHFLNYTCLDVASRGLEDATLIKEHYYCDSAATMIVAKLLGEKLQLNPGSSTWNFYTSIKAKRNCLVVSPYELPGDVNQIVAPLIDSFEDSSVENFIDEVVRLVAIKKIEFLFFGIASPKQNDLARLISERLNKEAKLTVFCIGAIVPWDAETKWYGNRFPLSGTGLEWVVHLIRSPKRFFKKIGELSKFMIRFIVSYRTRKELREIFEKFEKD